MCDEGSGPLTLASPLLASNWARISFLNSEMVVAAPEMK